MILLYTVLYCTVQLAILKMGWPPPTHVSPICKVEGVTTTSFVGEQDHILHLSPTLKYIKWRFPSTSLLENGWPPPPLTVLHCVILYSIVFYGIIRDVPVDYYTILYYTTRYATVLYCIILYDNIVYCTILYCTVHFVILEMNWPPPPHVAPICQVE